MFSTFYIKRLCNSRWNLRLNAHKRQWEEEKGNKVLELEVVRLLPSYLPAVGFWINDFTTLRAGFPNSNMMVIVLDLKCCH